MTFDEAVARSNKADKCVSVLWFLEQLKAFFVEVIDKFISFIIRFRGYKNKFAIYR